MARHAQKPAVKGSQRWLQQFVNERPELLDDPIRRALRLADDERIRWLSPLVGDDFAEYSNGDFLERMNVRLDRTPLRDFWPTGGPVWDGLATTTRGDVILLEAKAHLPEYVSPPCGATGSSLELIRRSLELTRDFVHGGSEHPWTGTFYQYTNRLAHLHLLRTLNDVPAWLVHVCFVGDAEMSGPSTADVWHGATQLLEAFLKIGRSRLSPYVVHVCPDVRLVR